MIRESTRNIGDFVLSLIFNKAVQHYIIKAFNFRTPAPDDITILIEVLL